MNLRIRRQKLRLTTAHLLWGVWILAAAFYGSQYLCHAVLPGGPGPDDWVTWTIR